MSGPFDKPDDPEDVTLWAGRLRAWPAPSTPDDLDDPDGDVGATLTARRRAERRGDGRRPEAKRRDAHGDVEGGDVDDDVDDTVIAPRVHPGDRVVDDLVDDTVIVPRERRVDSAAETDVTVRSPRGDGSEKLSERLLDDTTTAGRRASDLAGSLGATGPGRRRAIRDGANLESSADAAPRDTRVEPTSRDGGHARTARLPDTETPEAYGPRGDAAVRVQRTEPAPRVGPDHDAALVRPKSLRRGAATPLVIGGTTVVVLAGAVAAFVLLLR